MCVWGIEWETFSKKEQSPYEFLEIPKLATVIMKEKKNSKLRELFNVLGYYPP